MKIREMKTANRFRASGYIDKGHKNPRVSVSFDKETFKKIKKLAKEKEMSFGSQVRSLIERGLTA